MAAAPVQNCNVKKTEFVHASKEDLMRRRLFGDRIGSLIIHDGVHSFGQFCVQGLQQQFLFVHGIPGM